MVSEDDVIAAYRLIFGREPESSAAIRSHLGSFDSVIDMGRAFRGSPEGRARNAADLRSAGAAGDTTAALVKAATHADMILKHMVFRPGVAGYLALPLLSDDPIVAAYATGQVPNDYMLDILEALTAPGDQVVDLGGHVGTFCVPAALMERQVLAVDAASLHARLIETSVRANELWSLTVVRRAIAASEGTVPFMERGLFGAVDFGLQDANAALVPGMLLAVILEQQGFHRVRLIKMDIEGSELVALASITDVLAEDDGPAILYESNVETYQRAGYGVTDMRSWLEARGYHTFRIEGGRFVYAPPAQPQPELWVDVLALKPAHEKRFADRIDWVWAAEAVRDRFYLCASQPHDAARPYLGRLLAEPAVRGLHPDLGRLAEELAPEPPKRAKAQARVR